MRYRWPDGNQCAVVLSFDVDAESGHVFRDPEQAATRLDTMEERRFGVRKGLGRILRHPPEDTSGPTRERERASTNKPRPDERSARVDARPDQASTPKVGLVEPDTPTG